MSGSTTAAPLLAGVATMTINGDTFDVVSDLEYQVAGLKLETLKGQSRVEGASGMPEEGYLSGTLRVRPDKGITPYRGLRGVTAIGTLVNGIVVTVTAGWVTECGPVKTADGTWDFRVESGDVVEDVT